LIAALTSGHFALIELPDGKNVSSLAAGVLKAVDCVYIHLVVYATCKVEQLVYRIILNMYFRGLLPTGGGALVRVRKKTRIFVKNKWFCFFLRFHAFFCIRGSLIAECHF
jgi:hypothetical protein